MNKNQRIGILKFQIEETKKELSETRRQLRILENEKGLAPITVMYYRPHAVQHRKEVKELTSKLRKLKRELSLLENPIEREKVIFS